MTFENDKGLSIELKKQMQDNTIKKAKSLVGGEMIYELCQEIQEFLYNHNKPPPKSFYEQMLDNQKKLQDNEELEEATVFDIERKKFEEEHVSNHIYFKYHY